uniref:Uncharacterized protein n=1 Tax=Arundo donax TaxID=35708 RepID=A0A0A8Y656_ARUDO
MQQNLGEEHPHGVTAFSHTGKESSYFPTRGQSLRFLIIAL